MLVAITGGAGFIGSNLADRLLEDGHQVIVLDNLSTGREEFLEAARGQKGFELVRQDLLQLDKICDVIDGSDAVIHLAANADVRFGWDAPDRDLQQNTIATHNVLEAMRRTRVRKILFSSTGSVYGEAVQIPTPEDCQFPTQTSLYGASKLAAEAFVQAYAEGGVIEGTVFRFVSILGPRYTHGHVIDFVRHLRRDPTRLPILGDGTQRKSYLHVSDCVSAVVSMLDAEHRYEVYNLGVDGYCTVSDSASWICERIGVEPTFEYSGGDRGWVGDNPFIQLAVDKIRRTGWSPKFGIRESVEDTVDFLLSNPSLLELEER